jgi:hypothetical protein
MREAMLRALLVFGSRIHNHSSLHEGEIAGEKSDLFGIHKSDHHTSCQAEGCPVLHAILLDKKILDSFDTSKSTWMTSAKTILALGAIYSSDR